MDSKHSERTLLGTGPRLLIVSVIFSLPIIVFAYLTHPKYVIPSRYRRPFKIVGAMLAAVGLAFYVVSARTILKAFEEGRLVTTGVFGICRHPLYGSLMIAVIPGVFLFLGMPLLLPIPLTIYLTFRFIMMKDEEEPLIELFGAEYEEYRANVNAVFPRISFKKNRAS